MVNRVQHLIEQLEVKRQQEYYELEVFCDTYIVTLDTVLAVERQLEKMPEERWIEFRDLFGARHRLPAHFISRITESTPAARAAKRAFERVRDREDESDPFA